MFRKNDQHRQYSFMSGSAWLPTRLRQRLENSWAETFYREVFCRIDEETFAVLFSDEFSRPNSAVNQLLGADILKIGFGWSDEELIEQVNYNLQVRYALGLDDLGSAVFTLRTLYNFRRRIREHEERTGENLWRMAFGQVTDGQLEALEIAAGWQRMDSTQVLSNLAQWSRLELLVGVLQKAYAQLSAAMQARWQDRLHPYLDGRPHQVCYRIPATEQATHMQQVGKLFVELETELAHAAPHSAARALLLRVLDEQFVVSTAGAPTLREAKDVAADSLQSPHDPEATYRVKSGKAYRGGYVVNVSETVEAENKVQLITDVQVEPNCTDDAQLMKQSLADQTTRGIEVERVTTDGGYTGPTGEEACADYEVELRPTNLRGGKSSSEHWGWEDYTWELDADGAPVRVTCPLDVSAAVQPGRGEDCFIARFPRSTCEACPQSAMCRVALRSRVGPSLYVKQRVVEVALQRQRLHPEDTVIRTVVEATVREIKHRFAGGKLPVRGLNRARAVIFGSALMANLRRLHRYFTAEAADSDEFHPQSPIGDVSTPFSRLRTWFGRLRRSFVPIIGSRSLLTAGAS